MEQKGKMQIERGHKRKREEELREAGEDKREMLQKSLQNGKQLP